MLNKDLHKGQFKHIYIEERVWDHPVAQTILSKFSSAVVININHYKDVFNRPSQSFYQQKKNQSIILAYKEKPYLYKGSYLCEDFGYNNFYYSPCIQNCIYNCDYCYLQGLYPSGNIVIFVNIEDYLYETERFLKRNKLYLCVSYDSDIMALENIFEYSKAWIEFARDKENLLLEIRTKSTGRSVINKIEPCNNVILAWSLSPKSICESYERKTPSLDSRIAAVNTAVDKGWRARLCFEPLIKVDNFSSIYNQFIKKVFSSIKPKDINDIVIGSFRMNKEYYDKIKKMRIDTDIFCKDIITKDKYIAYKDEENMVQFVKSKVLEYCDNTKVF